MRGKNPDPPAVLGAATGDRSRSGRLSAEPMPESLAISPFGFRISDFFRISGLRISDFGFRLRISLRRAKSRAKMPQANGLPWSLDILRANGARACQPSKRGSAPPWVKIPEGTGALQGRSPCLLLTRVSARIAPSSGRSDRFIAPWPSGSVKLRWSGMAQLQSCGRGLAKALRVAPTESLKMGL